MNVNISPPSNVSAAKGHLTSFLYSIPPPSHLFHWSNREAGRETCYLLLVESSPAVCRWQKQTAHVCDKQWPSSGYGMIGFSVCFVRNQSTRETMLRLTPLPPPHTQFYFILELFSVRVWTKFHRCLVLGAEQLVPFCVSAFICCHLSSSAGKRKKNWRLFFHRLALVKACMFRDT
jgi:hypothetical protein